MLKGKLHRDPATERVTHDVDPIQAQLLDHDRQVAADVDRVDLPVAEGRMAVAVKVDPDDAPRFRQLGERRAEHAGREESTVQEQQRFSATMDFEPVIDAVGADVSARIGLHGHFLVVGHRSLRSL